VSGKTGEGGVKITTLIDLPVIELITRSVTNQNNSRRARHNLRCEDWEFSSDPLRRGLSWRR